jgi:hypothetical protein
MPAIPFDAYVESLGRLSARVDPSLPTVASDEIHEAVISLEDVGDIDLQRLSEWVLARPGDVFVLGLAVGLSREKLRNQLRDWFGTASWTSVARSQPALLVERLDEDYDLLRLLSTQLGRSYSFGDLLVARAGTRATATSAGMSGRRIENELEAIAESLGLPHAMRTRFEGRNGRTAPADLAVPSGGRGCVIAVAAKGFDSTGSKLSDAVREIEEMADARTGGQVALAVVDGIGWKGRLKDLHRIWSLWNSGQIDGLYTLASLDVFRSDLHAYASLRGVSRV